MKKFFLIAVVASLFSITAQAAERPANYYRPYGHNTRYTRTSESRSSQNYQRQYRQPSSYTEETENYQRQQYRQPSYYPQEVQPQPAPDYRSQQSAPSFYDNIQIRPVIGIDYVHSSADIDVKDGDGTDLSEFLEDKFNAFAISAGFKFNDYFGLEAFYQQSEKATKTTTRGYYSFVIEDQYKAYGLDLIAYYPVISQLDLIASLGVAYFKAEIKDLVGNENLGSEDKIGYRFGAGLQYYITDYLAFRLMARYNYTNIDGLDNIVDVTAGIRVYF